jgi:hypothetical protein
MPIVYVHGVANRLGLDGQLPGWDEVNSFLRFYIAPEISPDPENTSITYAYWGEFGADFRWGGISRPRSKLFGQGVEGPPSVESQLGELEALDELPVLPVSVVKSGGLTSGKTSAVPDGSSQRLRDLTTEQLSDLLCVAIEKAGSDLDRNRARIVADGVANDETVQAKLVAAEDSTEEFAILRSELESRTGSSGPLAAQGAGQVWTKVVDRAGELVTRVNSGPAFALSRLAMETRGPINAAVTTFIGDVFVYMAQRDHVPGTIRGAVLKALHDAKSATPNPDEPFIVISHSMGGQIVFDLATSFLEDAGIRIDFWLAAASQVGLFEELKLLITSDPEKRGPNGRADFPPNVGYWWNVWDANDILSYSTHSIFDLQVDDEEWNSGAALVDAHGAYLKRPSFYRKLAKKIGEIKKQNFNRPRVQ